MKKPIMKHILTVVLMALPVLGGGLLLGCGSAHQQESAGQFVDSSVITTKVKTKLLADKYVSALPITVKTYKNTVQLSGFVNSRAQKERAIQITKSVEGVISVQDALLIKKH